MTAPDWQSLRATLAADGGTVLLPGDAGYDASLERWSATCVKPAVSVPGLSRCLCEPHILSCLHARPPLSSRRRLQAFLRLWSS